MSTGQDAPRIIARTSRIIGVVVLAYAVSWSGIYMLVMEGDTRFFLEYLHLAWTSPGELPGLIQMYSLVCTLVFCAIAACVWLFVRQKKEAVPG